MKTNKKSLFRRMSLLIAVCIAMLGCLFIFITYLATVHYYQATTQRLNKDVAWHIAKFTSPFEPRGLNKKIADSIFFDAMVLSPSAEVYFLDTTGKVMYYHAPDSAIKQWQIPLAPIHRYIESQGLQYIKAPDPKRLKEDKIFSAADVISDGKKRGFIYVILGGNAYQTVSELLFGNHIIMLALQGIIAVIVLSIIVSLLYLSRIKKNLDKVNEVLNAHRLGDYAARFSSDNYDEFTPIAESFNQMADLLTYNIDKLQQSEKTRKDFIANISHDLRTPLTVIRGYVETIQEESMHGEIDKNRQIKITSLIYKKLEQLEIMIIQLFELSKMESIGFGLSREPFSIAELIEEMVAGLQKLASQKKITLCSTGSYEIPWIVGDIALVERCVQNLLDNAIRNTMEGGTVHVTLTETPDNYLELNICNTHGPLFHELEQWINSDTIHSDHLTNARRGLGLAIVKKIAQLHHYRFQVTHSNNMVCFLIRMAVYEKKSVPANTIIT